MADDKSRKSDPKHARGGQGHELSQGSGNEPVASRHTGTSGELSSSSEIAAFLKTAHEVTLRRGAVPEAARVARGRLVFALDATMSRQPTWDEACNLQAEMFAEAGRISGLEIQLIYFRGFRECRASRWVSDGATLADLMTRIDCRGGKTQIGKVLSQALKESRGAGKVSALVYIGDCMEENVDHLCDLAGELGLRGVPAFVFHEGSDPVAGRAFREIARLTRGAYCSFDTGAGKQLAALLRAAAAFASGGKAALLRLQQERDGDVARLMLEQLGDDSR